MGPEKAAALARVVGSRLGATKPNTEYLDSIGA
jgi:hypothetical protein